MPSACPDIERRLVLQARHDHAARERLVDACMPLVDRVARYYCGAAGIDREELLREGVVGVLRALERFDTESGTPFWGYASWWVREAMQRLVCERARPAVLTDRAAARLARARRAKGTRATTAPR